MQNPRKKTYVKWLLWIVGIGVALVGLALVASWWLPRYFKSELDSALKKSVVDASDSLYRITYDDISLNIPLGSAAVKNVKLTPDTTVYQRLLRLEKAPNDLFDLQAETIGLSGVSLTKLLFFKTLSIEKVLIDQPIATIDHDPQPYNHAQPRKSPYDLIKQVLASIRIGKISLNNVDFTYVNHSDKANVPQKSKLEKLYLDVTGFLLNEESEKDSSRIFFSDAIELKAEGLELPSGSDLYLFKMAELNFSTRDSILQVKRVHYQPQKSKNSFSSSLGYAADRLDLEFKNIKATQVDVRRFLMDRQLFAHRLYIDAGLMDIDKDKRHPPNPNKKLYEYPHQLLLRSKLKIGFDTVYLKSTRVLYGELDPDTGRRGSLFFDGTQGTITNLTNDSAWIARNRSCRVRVRTRFMGTGRLNAYFIFNMASEVGDFACGGTMSSFDMTRVNSVTQALASASVESGTVTKLDFGIEATTKQASIKMQMHYDDLKVKVLKIDEDTGKFKKRGFLTRVVNTVVLNENNPRNDLPARTSEATILRDFDESFFNLIWHSMFVSIKQITIGIGDTKRKQNRREARRAQRRANR